MAIDAANGFAYPAMDLALDWLPGAAKSQGIAIAGIRRSHHCGVAGVIVEALAERGVAALMVANVAGGDGAVGRPAAVVRHRPDCLCRSSWR